MDDDHISVFAMKMVLAGAPVTIGEHLKACGECATLYESLQSNDEESA